MAALPVTTAPSFTLRKETVQFLETLQGYLNCREELDRLYGQVDPSQSLEQIDISLAQHQQQSYQQQNIHGETVQSLQELYDAAEQARPVYRKMLDNLVHDISSTTTEQDTHHNSNVSPITLVCPSDLKTRDRAMEKIQDDYAQRPPGPGVSWLCDVLRGSVLVSTPAQVQACVQWFLREQQQDPNDSLSPHVMLVKAKNRFAHPTLTGYRDFILHIGIRVSKEHQHDDDNTRHTNHINNNQQEKSPNKMENTSLTFLHIVEVQIHIADLQQRSQKLKSHSFYEYFRSYFAGAQESLSRRLNDLELIAQGQSGGNYNTHENKENWIIRLVEQEQDDVERLDRLAKLFSEKLSEHIGALRCYERGLEIQRREYSEESAQVATCYFNMAMVQLRNGEQQLSLQNHQRALNIRQKVLDSQHPDMAKSFSGIARVLDDNDNFEESLEYFYKALDLVLQSNGEEHPDTAFIRGGIAIVLKNLGRLEESLDMYQKTLDCQKKVFGSGHHRISITYSGMAKVYDTDGQYDKSLDYYQQSLDIVTRELGKDHVHAAFCKNGMASVKCKQAIASNNNNEKAGLLKESLDLFHQALEIRIEALGSSHPKTADTYCGIAKVLREQGDYEQALEKYKLVIDTQKKKLGNGSRKVADTMSSMALVYEKQQNYEKAVDSLQQVVLLRIETFGKESLKVATSRIDLARVLEAQSNYNEAIAMLKLAKQVFERHYEPTNPKLMEVNALIEETESNSKRHVRCLARLFPFRRRVRR